ncbi:MAG: 3'-5' exonuclease [Bacteroidota bacterium]
MKFIVYDIEATCWEGTPPGLVQETIEIGAYRLDRFGDIEAAFSRLIKPIMHPQLSLYCQRLTQIDQADINRAQTFDRVAESFIDWMGFYDTPDVVLASWGKFDTKQLRKDSLLHRLETDWLEYSIDLKEQYRRIRGLPKLRGLKSAVRHEGFDWIGDQHRALDDAKNTVQLFRKFFDDWQY